MDITAFKWFVCGALWLGYAVIATVFLRYWRRTRDRLFGVFAFAFTLLAIERVVMLFVNLSDEEHSYVYGIRLVAFVAIILAILEKNRAPE